VEATPLLSSDTKYMLDSDWHWQHLASPEDMVTGTVSSLPDSSITTTSPPLFEQAIFSTSDPGHSIFVTMEPSVTLQPLSTPTTITTTATTVSVSPAPSTPLDQQPQTPDTKVDVDKILRRQRNTNAARKYRQKKFDRITELESQLKRALADLDECKLKLARQEAENAAIKEILRLSSK
jgi:hypothetical protein